MTLSYETQFQYIFNYWSNYVFIMKELPLAVVISVLIKDNQILLIKRLRGDYVGLLGLPGGKIEKNEHLSEAAIREILEESGIESDFKNHLGFVSEHLIENGNILQHFLLHICKLEPKTTDILNDSEVGPKVYEILQRHYHDEFPEYKTIKFK